MVRNPVNGNSSKLAGSRGSGRHDSRGCKAAAAAAVQVAAAATAAAEIANKVAATTTDTSSVKTHISTDTSLGTEMNELLEDFVESYADEAARERTAVVSSDSEEEDEEEEEDITVNRVLVNSLETSSLWNPEEANMATDVGLEEVVETLVNMSAAAETAASTASGEQNQQPQHDLLDQAMGLANIPVKPLKATKSTSKSE